MKFDRSNKFYLCYYGQVNSLRLKLSVVSKWASKHLCGCHLFFWRWDTNNDMKIKYKKKTYLFTAIIDYARMSILTDS